MNEGFISALIILGLILMAKLVSYIDKKKPEIKVVNARIEVYKKEKGRIKKISA